MNLERTPAKARDSEQVSYKSPPGFRNMPASECYPLVASRDCVVTVFPNSSAGALKLSEPTATWGTYLISDSLWSACDLYIVGGVPIPEIVNYASNLMELPPVSPNENHVARKLSGG